MSFKSYPSISLGSENKIRGEKMKKQLFLLGGEKVKVWERKIWIWYVITILSSYLELHNIFVLKFTLRWLLLSKLLLLLLSPHKRITGNVII